MCKYKRKNPTYSSEMSFNTLKTVLVYYEKELWPILRWYYVSHLC